MKNIPATLSVWFVNVIIVKTVVTRKRVEVYIFALRSNIAGPGWKSSPRENAPRILEIEEPITFPRPREGLCCRRAAMTTAS